MLVRYLSIVAIVFAGLFAAPEAANAKVHHYLFGNYEDGVYPAKKVVNVQKHKRHVAKKHHTFKNIVKLTSKKVVKQLAHKKVAQKIVVAVKAAPTVVAKPAYLGRQVVQFASNENKGTIIIKTQERALYEVLGGGKAMRYLVAVGKEGFAWSGVARVGSKRVDPTWTPPAEMIQRKPELAKWTMGIPGGDPENPLGPRAMYLYKGKYDTGFRIHGTIHPESIGTAASSGCIRMLNAEVIELFQQTRVGTKVIVL